MSNTIKGAALVTGDTGLTGGWLNATRVAGDCRLQTMASVRGEPGQAGFARYGFATSLAVGFSRTAGYSLRKALGPRLFSRTGWDVSFERNMILRRPSRIKYGDTVTTDDNCNIAPISVCSPWSCKSLRRGTKR